MADNLPGGNITKFSKEAYEKLVKFVDEVGLDIDDRFLKAVSTVTFDQALGSFIKAGSTDWPVITALKEGANRFGGSVNEKFIGLSDEWTRYEQALIAAMRTFEKHSDLATLSAKDFLDMFPDLSPKSL